MCQAKGQFYCMLKTPSSTLLSRLHGSQLIPVHAFPRYDRVETMRYPSGAQDETLLVLAKAGEGVYDLMEIGPKGNTMIRMTSTYWVSDVDGSIPAVFLEWDESVPSILWEDGPNEKGEELSRMLTRLLGNEGSRSVSATDVTFQTWETDGMPLSLSYQNIIDGNCRLVIY